MRRICELFVPRVKLPRPSSTQKLGQERTVLVPTHPFYVETREEHRHRFPNTNFSFGEDRK